MGFLIGKANETLQEFETTNQNIRFDDFINPERSINKSAQAYAFREKGIFEYEFQFMQDLDYRNLLYLIKNRSSLREGLINIPIPYSSEPDSTIILPTVSTLNKVYYGGYLESTAKPWEVVWGTLPKVELTSGEYSKVRVNDANAIWIAPLANWITYYLLQFNATDFITDFSYKELRRLTLGYIGMNSSPMRFFIWSPTYEQWYLIDDRYYYDDTAFDYPVGGGEFSLNKQQVASFTLPWSTQSIYKDFVDTDNTVKFMVSNDHDNETLMMQYCRLFINGYWTMMAGPQDFENYSTAFTGAGRVGKLTLMEM